MKYLISSDIRKGQMSEIMTHENKNELIHQISKAITISCSVDYLQDMSYIDQCVLLLPSKCKYSLVEYSSHKDNTDGIKLPTLWTEYKLLMMFSKLKLWYIMIWDSLSEWSYYFI